MIAIGAKGAGRLARLRACAPTTAMIIVECTKLEDDERQLRAIAREAALHDAVIVLRDVDVIAKFARIEHVLLAGDAHVFATASAASSWSTTRDVVLLRVALPDAAHRAVLWEDALGGASDPVIAECARRYAISPSVIEAAARSAP